jgi:multiple sugar transport system permease protein
MHSLQIATAIGRGTKVVWSVHSSVPLGIHIDWLSTANGGLAAAMILDIWMWTPFVFLMSLAALSAIPTDIYDAAMLESSSHWQVFRHVAIPLALPVLTIAILLRVIGQLR